MNAIRKILLGWLLGKPSNRYDAAYWTTARAWIQGTFQDSKLDLCKADRETLASKVRELERNNGIVNKCADLSEQFVAGPGGMPVMAASSSPDWNVRAQAWWDQWCNMCDIASLQSFGTVQGLLSRMMEIDGEAFILKTEGSTGNPRIQILEGHRFETPPELKAKEGQFPGVIDGVEVDEKGRPTGYFFWELEGPKKVFKRFDAAVVIHYFEPSRPGQYRGLTPWHAVINDLIDLDDLQMLEMRAAKDAAEISNVLSTESGEINVNDLRRELVGTSNQNSSGSSVEETRAKHIRDVLGGRSIALKQGEKIEQFRSDRPNVATQDYWDYLIGKICAGRGISKMLVFPYLKLQGTMVRAELDCAAGFFRCRSMVLADVLRQIWIYVIGTAIRRTPELAASPKDWWKVNIIPPRAPNVDVGYASAAVLAEWKAGTRTLSDICAPLGKDWKAVLRQRAIEAQEIERLAEEFGIDDCMIANPSEEIPTAEDPAEDTTEDTTEVPS